MLCTRCPCGYESNVVECDPAGVFGGKSRKHRCKGGCPDPSTLLGQDEAADATFLARLTAALSDGALADGQTGADLTIGDVRAELARENDFLVRVHNPGQVMAQPDDWRTGVQVLRDERCSDVLAAIPPFGAPPGIRGCQQLSASQRGPYADSATPGCSTEPLELDDAARDQPYTAFLSRLDPPPPPPLPPPSQPPPAPPIPPSPSPPPQPPAGLSANAVRAVVFDMQRSFCDTTYLLSTEARCTALAFSLQQTILLGEGFSPPTLPPAAPSIPSPPPPPSPPWPGVPKEEEGRIVFQEAAHVTLSTYFLPALMDPAAEAALSTEAVAADTYEVNAGNHAKLIARSEPRAHMLDALDRQPGHEWAACTMWLEHVLYAPLPCRTGDVMTRCMDGARRCDDPNGPDPMEAPWLELDVRSGPPATVYGPLGEQKPRTPDYYLFAVWFELPDVDEYAALLFQSPDAGNPNFAAGEVGSGYELVLRDDHHQVLDVQCEPLSAQSITAFAPGLRRVQHRCLAPTAEPAAYETLTRVAYVRLVLPGRLRMIWLDGLTLEWRSPRDFPPSPPPPPPDPPAPPVSPSPGAPPLEPPPSPPPGSAVGPVCAFYRHRTLDGSEVTVDREQYEPCQLTPAECCDHLYEHRGQGFDAFVLSAHGCCTLQVIAAGDALRMYAAKLWLTNPLNDNATHGGAMTALALWPAGGD